MCKTAKKSPQSNQSNQKCIKKNLLNCVQVICSPDKFYACRSAARTCTFCPLKPIQTQLLSDLGVCVCVCVCEIFQYWTSTNAISPLLSDGAALYCIWPDSLHITTAILFLNYSGGIPDSAAGFTMIPPQLLRSTVCQVIILPTCKHVNWSARRVMQ